METAIMIARKNVELFTKHTTTVPNINLKELDFYLKVLLHIFFTD